MSSIPKSIEDIKGCIQSLKKEQECGPITDNCTELQKFCAKLEYILQIDMKVRVGMLGSKKDYWEFFCSCLGKVKGLNDGIRFVKGMKEVKTSLGRGRAFIRYSLVHHRLGDTLQQCVSSDEITRQWYNESSILRQPGAFSAVVNDLYDLNDIQFDLAPSGHELDTAWPSFARSAIGVGLYLWNPPTRSSSMASINSQPSQADSRGMESMTEVDSAILDSQLEKLQAELNECENYNRDLRRQLQASQSELEETKNLALENEARMSSELGELERKNQELTYKSDQAIAENKSAQREKEEALQRVNSMSEEHQRITNELGERIETLKMQLKSEASMRQKHEDEQRGECLDYQKRIGELEVKLQGSEMELKHLREVETRLKASLEDAETKNKSLEKRTERLTATMDSNLTSRSDQLSKEFESVSLLRSLFIRLSSVQSEDKELNNMKREFYAKLESLLGVQTGANAGSDGNVDVGILDGALSQLEDGITATQQEIKDVKVELEDAQGSNATPGHRGAMLEEAAVIEKLQRRIKELTEELEEWKLTAEQRRNLILDRDLRLKEKTTQVTHASSELKSIKDSVVALLDASQTMLQTIPALKSLESEVPQCFLSPSRKSSLPVADIVKALPNFLQALEGKFGDIQDEKDVLKETLAMFEEEKMTLNKRLENEMLIKENLNKQTDTFQQRIEEVVSSQAEKEKTIKELEAELLKLRELLEEQDAETNQTKNVDEQIKNDLSAEVERLKTQLRESDENLKRMEMKCNDLEEEANSLKATQLKVLNDKQSALSQNAELEERIITLEEELAGESSRVKDLEEMASQKDEVSHQEKASLEESHEKTIAEVIQEHENKVEFMTEQFKLLKDELETVTLEKNDLLEKTDKIRKESLEVQNSAEVAEKETTEMKDKFDKLSEEQRILKGNCDAVTSQYQTLKTEYETLLDTSGKDKELLETRAETIQKLDNALDCARETAKESHERICRAEEQLAEKQQQLEQLEEKLKASEEECRNSKIVMEREVSAIEFQRSSEAMQYQEKLESMEELNSELLHLKERCEILEENLAAKEKEIQDLKVLQETSEEKTKHIMKAHDNTFDRQKSEISVLETSLLQVSNQLEQKTRTVVELEEEVKSMRRSDANEIDLLKAKLEQREKDNEELMMQIVKFGKEKDVMWQRLQKIEIHRKAKAMERWMNDKDVVQCMECEATFTLTVRRHHCRLCGGIYCSKCTDYSIFTSQSKKKVRVCEKCFIVHNHSLESESQDTSAIIGDEEEGGLTFKGSRLSLSSVSSLTDTPSTSAVGSDVEQIASKELPSLKDLDGTVGRETVKEDGDNHHLGGTDESLGGAEEETKKESDPADVSVGESSPERDADFHIITDDDVTEVRQEEPVDNQEESSSRPEHTQFESVTSQEIESAESYHKEVYLAAGTAHLVPVIMDAEGVLLCWEFSSSPKSIAFKVAYAESFDDEVTEEIVPLQRFNSHHQSASGELLTYKKGVYVLQFDNTFSRLTPKTVIYQLAIKEPDISY